MRQVDVTSIHEPLDPRRRTTRLLPRPDRRPCQRTPGVVATSRDAAEIVTPLCTPSLR
ncbi:MAG: hypothetical protein ACYDC9_09270 [Dermatophilaceae bacterium]